MTINVLPADDSSILREGLAALCRIATISRPW